MIGLSLIIFLLVVNVPNSLFQQIFHEELMCNFKNKNMPKNEQNIFLQNTVWDITGRGKNADTHVRFSLCDKLAYSDECDPNAAICIYNKNKKEKNVRNAGEYFLYTSDNGKKILQSMNGELCDGTDRFTVIIQFESNPEMNAKPKFIFMDDCELRIEMMWPMYSPPCTFKENGYLIDLRPLKKLPSFSINNPKNNQNYSLSICQQSQICGDHVSGCQILEKSVIPLGRVEYEHITYAKNGNLVIKSHFGENKRSRRSYELTLRCNWKANEISNLVLVAEGKNVKFKADSSLACVKIPNYCSVRSQHMLYDLHKLTKTLEVRNVTTGSIKINVCYSLNLPHESNDCTDEYSQVCHQTHDNEMINLGSIAKNFEVTPDHTVRGSFQDGSICFINRNLTYSTDIEFICNVVEEGPILIGISGCTYRLKWLTPAACPLNSPHLDNCVLQDSTASNINLNSLYKVTDTVIPLPGSSSFLRYNVCGALKLPCDNNTNAAVCYVEGGNKELVVGVLNKRLLIENEVITLNLLGESKDCATKIKFHCNQMIPKTIGEQVRVDIIKEKCNFEVNVETPLACGKTITSDCTFTNDVLSYNLSGLSRLDDNYRIQFDNEIYFLNLCRSVLRIDNMCSITSAVCLKKLDEPHIQYKYESLGSASRMEYIIDKGDLIISLQHGSFCRESDSLSKTSSIRFQCAEAEEGIKLFQKNKCHYEFVWSTPHACPIRTSSLQMRSLSRLCTIRDINNTKSIDLSNFEIRPHIQMNNSRSYKLDFCSNEYLECNSSLKSNCTSKNAKREVFSDSSNLYLSYLLDHSCEPFKKPNRINFFLICDDSDYRLEVINVTNCVFNINLKSDAACENKTLQINRQTCKNEDLQLINLKNANITSAAGTVYTLNFENKTSSCNGTICKGSYSVLSPSDGKCRSVKYDYANSFGLLEYKSEVPCNSRIDNFVSQFLLKCSFDRDTPVILEESECKVVIEYPLSEMCSIFNLSIVSAKSTGVAVGVGVGVVTLALIFVIAYIFYKKQWCLKNFRYNSISGDKHTTMIYLRDTTN